MLHSVPQTEFGNNTLTLRETDLVLRGLTIDRKPLKDHMEAEGHKEAFEREYWNGAQTEYAEIVYTIKGKKQEPLRHDTTEYLCYYHYFSKDPRRYIGQFPLRSKSSAGK